METKILSVINKKIETKLNEIKKECLEWDTDFDKKTETQNALFHVFQKENITIIDDEIFQLEKWFNEKNSSFALGHYSRKTNEIFSYEKIEETEKAIHVRTIKIYDGGEKYSFWIPKSAIKEI